MELIQLSVINCGEQESNMVKLIVMKLIQMSVTEVTNKRVTESNK